MFHFFHISPDTSLTPQNVIAVAFRTMENTVDLRKLFEFMLMKRVCVCLTCLCFHKTGNTHATGVAAQPLSTPLMKQHETFRGFF